MKGLQVLMALWLGLSLAARADTILLDNGKSLKGRIVKRDGASVTIQMDNGGRITLPAARIVLVTPDAPAPAPAVKPDRPVLPDSGGAEEPGREPGKGGAGEKGTGGDTESQQGEPGEKPPEPAPAPVLDPALAAEIARLIDSLGEAGDGELETRSEAKAALVRIGEPAVESLCKALEDANWYRRLNAALALGEIGSKTSVKPLVAAIYTGTPQSDAPAWWERNFLDACAASLKRITGQGAMYDADKVSAGKYAVEILDWWAANAKDYPLQAGDKPPEPGPDGKLPEPPDPAEEIKKLPPRRFPRPEGT